MSTDRRRRRFERLFDDQHRAVLAYALRRTSDAHDAADVVAETFLVAWRRIDDVPSGDPARLWLFGVARRVLANHRRGDRRRTELSARLGETLGTQLAASSQMPVPTPGPLGPALASLSGDDREVLLLSAWEGLEPAEIATTLGLRGSTVRSRLRRARARLEAALTAQGWDGDDPPPHPTGAPPERELPTDHRPLIFAEDLA